MNLKGKSLLKLMDFSQEEIYDLLKLASDLKKDKAAGIPHRICEGKNIALVFEKCSTRTRCAFEVAAHDLGIETTFLSPSETHIGQKESIKDTARVLGHMFDGIEYRGFDQSIPEELAAYSGVPVWNGLTNQFHPTQMLADLLTIQEHFGSLKNIKLCYLGDARNNTANSLMAACAVMGMQCTLCAPAEYFPGKALTDTCIAISASSGGKITFCQSPALAVQNANVIYTDVWVSMGESKEIWKKRIDDLSPYQVNDSLMKKAAPDAIFMHCLPAFHNKETVLGKQLCEAFGRDALEVTDDVFEGKQSVVFQEAENRMHTIKAVMAATL